jgi:hypothetical protein
MAACWTMLDAVAGAVRMTSKRDRAIGPGFTRVALSLACVLATEFLCCLALALRGVVSLHQPFHLHGFLRFMGYGGTMLLLFSWPGWVAAVPAVLWLTDLRSWRFWVILALGTAIGPLTELVELAVLSHGRWKIGWFAVLFFPTIVAGISTLLYLLLLRGLQRRHARKEDLIGGRDQGAVQL